MRKRLHHIGGPGLIPARVLALMSFGAIPTCRRGQLNRFLPIRFGPELPQPGQRNGTSFSAAAYVMGLLLGRYRQATRPDYLLSVLGAWRPHPASGGGYLSACFRCLLRFFRGMGINVEPSTLFVHDL